MTTKGFAGVAAPLLLGAFAAGTARASSFYLSEQSIKATGRAFSGEAADQGPESLWWNPAAIAAGHGVSGAFGAAAILPKAHVRDAGTTIVRPGQAAAPVGGIVDPKNPVKHGVLPSGAIAAALTPRLSIGLAVTSPYSFTTDYEPNSWTRYIAARTRLRTIDLQPTIAFALTDQLRIGAGANIEHASATLNHALPNLSPLLPDGFQQLKGKAWDVGWSAGAQYVTSAISVGLSYKSSIKHDFKGTLTISGLLGPIAGSNMVLATHANFSTPWQAIGSIRVHASPRLTLQAQATRLGWSKLDRIRLTLPAGAFVPEDYRDSWMVSAGFDYAAGDATTIRGGVSRDQTPTQDGRRDPNVPDGSRTGLSLGLSQKLGTGFTVDAAASYLFFDKVSIDRQATAFEGTPVATQIRTNGTATAHALIFGLGGRFQF